MALVLVGGTAAGALVWKDKLLPRERARADYITEPVKRGNLEITVIERGSTESANNETLYCMVEGEAGTGILKIVDEGSRVTAGETLVELDSSRQRNEATQQQIVVEQADASLQTAEKNLDIQKTQNESDIAAAKLKLELALLDEEKYKEGDFKQEFDQLDGEIKVALEDLTRATEKYKFTQRLIKKGYATQNELEADRIAQSKAKVALDVAERKMDVLKQYTQKRNLKELEANSKEYDLELKRVELKAQAALAKCNADLKAAKLTYQVEKEQYDKLLKQIDVCKIKAPRDGLVVYANVRPGGGGRGFSNEPLIYEGAKVKERQAIIYLPDVTRMQVNVRVHESKISLLRRELPATIRIDARHGETFDGKVDMVSLVPISGNWPNFNLKEYVTIVKMTDQESKVSQLKPGLTAEVEILVDRLDSVLQAPVQAFVERGGRHFTWVLINDKPVRREVKLGKANEIAIHVLEDESLYGQDQGLKEGDRVIISPRTVLPKEVATLEEEVPATAPVTTPTGKLPEGPAGPGRGAPGGGATPGGASPGGGPGPAVAQAGGAPGEGGGRRGGGGQGMPDPATIFAQLDKNSDGKITDDEIPEQMKQFISISRLDANKNNAIDKDEWMKAAAERAAQRGAGGGGGEGRRGAQGGAPPQAGGGQ